MPRGANTQSRTFTYTNGLLTSEQQPETGTTTYSYVNGNQIYRKTDAKGQVTQYEYDAYFRVKTIRRYPAGITGSEDICQRTAYTYDSFATTPTGFNGSSNLWGRVASIASGDPSCVTIPGSPGSQQQQQFTQLFQYTSTGRITTKRLQLDQVTITIQCSPLPRFGM